MNKAIEFLLKYGTKTVPLITPVVRWLPVLRVLKGSYDAGTWAGTAAAQGDRHASPDRYTPEIAKYEASALGSSRII